MMAKRISLLLVALLLPNAARAQNGGTAFVVPVSGGSGGSASNAQPPSDVLTNLANNTYTGYTNELFWSRTIFTDTNGNDATAVRGDPKKPFLGISNAVAALQSGDTLHVRAGDYTIFDHAMGSGGAFPVKFQDKSNINVFVETGARWLAQGIGNCVLISNCPGLRFNGLTVVGNKTNAILAAQSFLFMVRGTNRNITFDGVRLERGANQGISMIQEPTDYHENTAFIGCTFIDIGATNMAGVGGADGAAVTTGVGTRVTGCTFWDCIYGVESYQGFNQGILIQGCAFYNPKYAAYVSFSSNCADLSFVGNVVKNYQTNGFPASLGGGSQGVRLAQGTDVTITGNVFDGLNTGVGHDGITTLFTKNVTISGNTFISNSSPVSIQSVIGWSGRPSGISISGNTVSRSAYDGFSVAANNSVIENNLFIDPAGNGASSSAIQAGIAGYTTNCTNMVIRDNTTAFSGETSTAGGGVTVAANQYNSTVMGNIYKGTGTAVSDGGVNTFGLDYIGNRNNVATNSTFRVYDRFQIYNAGSVWADLNVAGSAIGDGALLLSPYGNTDEALKSLAFQSAYGVDLGGADGPILTNEVPWLVLRRASDGTYNTLGVASVRASEASFFTNQAAARAGASVSNHWFNGTLYRTTTPISNTGDSATNLHTYTVPAHTLTNNNDALLFNSALVFTNAVESSTIISVVYGSQTIATLTAAMGALAYDEPILIQGEIARSGNTAQSAWATIQYGEYGAGSQKNHRKVLNLAQTNGIATLFAIRVDVQDGTYGTGLVTNMMTSIDFKPAPR